MIAPVFQQLSETYTDVTFVKIDVDEMDSLSQQCGISAMPTFQFYKGGTKIDEMRGANKDLLEASIKKHK